MSDTPNKNGPDLHLRRAGPADAEALARVHIDSWCAAYRGIVPDAFLDRLDYARRAAQFRQWLAPEAAATYVAEEDGEVRGFMMLGTSRDAGVDKAVTGEIWGIYLAPNQWRKGIGSRMCGYAEELLSSQGFGVITLWVFEANAAARRFYEAMGFRADGTVSEMNADAPLKVVRYRKELKRAVRGE